MANMLQKHLIKETVVALCLNIKQHQFVTENLHPGEDIEQDVKLPDSLLKHLFKRRKLMKELLASQLMLKLQQKIFLH